MKEIILKNENNKILASSYEVAKNFEKRHDNVLQAIYRLLSEDLLKNKEIFFEAEEPDSYGRMQKIYYMTRDGFTLLVMGFTGKKALEWKWKYIEAFNQMENIIKFGGFKVPMTYRDALVQLLEKVDENEQLKIENSQLKIENDELLPKAEFHDAIAATEDCIDFGTFAATLQNQKIINFGKIKLMQWFRDNKFLCAKKEIYNKPVQYMLKNGYLQYEESVYTTPYGTVKLSYKPLVTGKGQIYFSNKLKEISM